MTESKPRHTPGPWDNNSRKTVVRQTEQGEWIADVGGQTTAEAIVNAALIARAPDLLAENERLRGQLTTTQGERDRAFQRAEKAEACLYKCGTKLTELREAAQRYVDSVDSFPQDYELDTKGHGLAVCLNNRSGELLRAALARSKGEG